MAVPFQPPNTSMRMKPSDTPAAEVTVLSATSIVVVPLMTMVSVVFVSSRKVKLPEV